MIQARFNISEVTSIKYYLIPILIYDIIFSKVDDWMAQVDANNDGKLSYDEFKKSLDEKITVTE